MKQPNRSIVPALLRDIRVLQALGQIIFVILVVAAVAQLLATITTQLESKNLTPTFNFLQNRAGFDIGEKPDWYTPEATYGTAFVVGVLNTLRIVSIGLVATTILGVFVGIFLLSSNWLIRTISEVYVEILRNTPLLVQLFVWYFIVMFSLPTVQQALALPGEGITLLPYRLLIDLVVYVLIRRSVRDLASHAPRRIFWIYGFFATAILIEIFFLLDRTQPAWPLHYGQSLLTAGFLVYMVVSGVLIAAASAAPRPVRPHLLGIVGGQALAGLLFYLGIIPAGGLRLELHPAVYISIRGFVFPQIVATARFAEWLAFVVVGLVLAAAMWSYFGRITETTGRVIPRGRYALLAIIGFMLIGWLSVGIEPAPERIPVQQDGQTVYLTLEEARAAALLTAQDELLYSRVPLAVNFPQEKRNRVGNLTGFENGTQISPEYMALLLGLVIYTSAFIAEIVRAGIQAVPRGQIEASRALGLSTGQTLSMVILPQALRVIIPPLGNQYLNLAKNSSLALAIAYNDIVQVTNTMMNQSGQSVTGIFMIMVTYLVMSLSIATLMNWVNGRFQLVTR